jgi:3-phytase
MRKLASLTTMLLCGCAATEVPVAVRIANADPAVIVSARGETTPVGSEAQDAADDPAIWRNPADPAASLIVGTDKKAGLYVYGLGGETRSFLNAGRVNNVDLKADVMVGGSRQIVVVASDRNDLAQAKFALFTLDPRAGILRSLGTLPAGKGEAYGTCLAKLDNALHGFMVAKDGTIRQYSFDLAGQPSATLIRTMKLATQSEGCAVDESLKRLYVAEEDRGLWRFDLTGDLSAAPVMVAPADGKKLVADVEGVAVAASGRGGGYLVVSSQGDNAYAVWSLGNERWLGRFRIAAGKQGATEETDGIELQLGDFGSGYPGGLFIAQDGVNAPSAQNFKLVAWADVLEALKSQQERK